MTVYGTHENPWFIANEIAALHEIKNIRENLRNANQGETDAVSFIDSIGRRQKTTIINEICIYRLIMRSNKEIAKRFQNWVFQVIKEIRLTGAYKIQKELENEQRERKKRILKLESETREIDIRNNKAAIELLKDIGCFDDRVKAMVQSNMLNTLLITDGSAQQDEKDKECSLSKRVQDLYGINLSVKNNHGKLSIRLRGLGWNPILGKKIKKKYIERYGEPPSQREQYVHGTIRSVNHYTVKNWEECLDAVLKREFLTLA